MKKKKQKKSPWFFGQVDPEGKIPPFEQALQIALHHSYQGVELAKKTVETFGFAAPFPTLLEAKQAHIASLTSLLGRYGVLPPPNPWPQALLTPANLQEASELAVAFEIRTIARFNHLLPFVATQPEAQELFFQMQAAAHNTYLPTLRASVVQYAQQNQAMPQENMLEKVQEWQSLAQSLAAGQADPNTLNKLFSSLNLSLVGGMLLGGVAASLLGANLSQPKDQEDQNDSSESPHTKE
jgi:hypothetical protein